MKTQVAVVVAVSFMCLRFERNTGFFHFLYFFFDVLVEEEAAYAFEKISVRPAKCLCLNLTLTIVMKKIRVRLS